MSAMLETITQAIETKLTLRKAEIVYPERDNEPMADNTKQFNWIFRITGNLAALFHLVVDVFVGGNQNWFPREGEPELFKAPDVYVVCGRPKGDRTSWKQWEENDVPLTVVFEILSPKNSYKEMADKLAFYEDYGVEEYYIYDPDRNELTAYKRGKAALVLMRFTDSYTSPRLGIRFDLTGNEMQIFYPDGRPFLSFEQLEAERCREQKRADSAEQRADSAETLAATEKTRADNAESMVRKLARVVELSRKARRGLASDEELRELEQLEVAS